MLKMPILFFASKLPKNGNFLATHFIFLNKNFYDKKHFRQFFSSRFQEACQTGNRNIIFKSETVTLHHCMPGWTTFTEGSMIVLRVLEKYFIVVAGVEDSRASNVLDCNVVVEIAVEWCCSLIISEVPFPFHVDDDADIIFRSTCARTDDLVKWLQ